MLILFPRVQCPSTTEFVPMRTLLPILVFFHYHHSMAGFKIFSYFRIIVYNRIGAYKCIFTDDGGAGSFFIFLADDHVFLDLGIFQVSCVLRIPEKCPEPVSISRPQKIFKGCHFSSIIFLIVDDIKFN